MFMESWPWKRDLGEAAERLAGAAQMPNLGVREDDDPNFNDDDEVEAFYRVERDVMAGCFAVRRLIGMPSKVTQHARTTKAAVTQFPLLTDAHVPHALEGRDVLGSYRLEAPTRVVISANELCNLFVHSLIFSFAWTIEGLSWADWRALGEDDPRLDDPGLLAGFLVATDKSSGGHLTLVDLPEIVRIFRIFAQDEVKQVVVTRDYKGRAHVSAS